MKKQPKTKGFPSRPKREIVVFKPSMPDELKLRVLRQCCENFGLTGFQQ